jgi:branched-chain amino acid transport system substrate-binding protein
MRKKILGVVVLLALIAVAAIPAGGTSQAQDEALKIGVLTDHTGALAFYGFEQTQGFQLGLEYATDGTMEVAGRTLEVVERDNAGDTETGVNDARQLIEEEGVEVLVGTVSSTVTLSLVESAKEYETVLFAGPAAAPQVTGTNFNEFVFRVCRNSFQDALTVATYSLENFGTSYVQLAPDTAFGTG